LKYTVERGCFLSTKFKTDSSKRIVPIPQWLDFGKGSGLIFTKQKGQLGRYIKKYAKLADVPVIRLHDFRHSYVAMLINKGVDIYTISKMVGHTKIDMTIGTYGHLYPDKRQEITNIFD
jgi:Site-specific recombinase XerD